MVTDKSGVLGAAPLGEGVDGDEVPARGRLSPLRFDFILEGSGFGNERIFESKTGPSLQQRRFPFVVGITQPRHSGLHAYPALNSGGFGNCFYVV